VFGAVFDDESQSLVVSGEIDETSADRLRELIETHSDDSRPLVVDLSGVEYLPSAAVGVLATALEKAGSGGRSVELLADQGSIAERVLTVCALPHRTS
jgi:anti-anti-sigma factor